MWETIFIKNVNNEFQLNLIFPTISISVAKKMRQEENFPLRCTVYAPYW